MADKNFINDFKNELVNGETNISITENGAPGYRTTGSLLVDTNFKIPSLRKADINTLENIWVEIYNEDPILSTLFLFYVGDIRKGLGERKIFRTWLRKLCKDKPDVGVRLIDLVPVYSRWDIIWDLIGYTARLDEKIKDLVMNQYKSDVENMRNGKPISLLGKWLPSYNTSSFETKKKAIRVAKVCFNIDLTHNAGQQLYRKMISNLRKYINVLERKISANEWKEIDYSSVPSNANIKYKNAFIKHDSERYFQFLNKAMSGKEKINASVVFPSDIVHSYIANQKSYEPNYSNLYLSLDDYDMTCESMWKNLPTYDIEDNTICVLDTSGSMTNYVNGKMTAIEVGASLAIYCAEHMHGAFKNNMITFSSRPELISFNDATSLKDKLAIIDDNSLYDNTNIEAVFSLILKTAVDNHYSQSDLPNSIMIISDMEFDAQITGRKDARLFEEISRTYSSFNYKMPKLIFWNVNSRTNTIPVKENKAGVILVSGYSINVMNMVLSNKLDPAEVLMETLTGERYKPVMDALPLIMSLI